MAAQLTLFFAPGASSMAPHIALHEIGCPFEGRPMSFHAGDLRKPEYRAINAEGNVPTLLIDGRPLTEVAAILYYLARAYPEARLWPAGDMEAQARIVSWMSFTASTLHPARKKGLEHAMAVYAIADQRLGGREWLVDDYSIADIHLFRLFWRLASSLKPERKALPNLFAHHDRMLARPAVRRTLEAEAAVGYELPA
jgi:glutathione S-transferase